MENDVLFEIKKENLETGLRGFPVGYCVTSTVHPENGLFYSEHSIKELAGWQPEEVIFLLWKGYRGSVEEIANFKDELKKRSKCSEEALKHVKMLPKKGHPMSLYAASILILGSFECLEDYEEDCLNLIAKIPELTATVINHHGGFSQTAISRPELGYMENFCQMLQLPHQTHQNLPEILKLFNILHYDHGGGNLSTFVGKAVASGLADMYTSISSSMNALSGARHGGANQECLHFVQKLQEELGKNAKLADVEDCLRKKLKNNELIYGFGHAVLRVEDPRATVQYKLAQELFSEHPLVKMALLTREAGTKVLKENPKVANPYPNVDHISGTLLTAAGFDFPEYYTVLFGLSRTVGIALQIVYERRIAREGKGTPIVRPKYLYKSR